MYTCFTLISSTFVQVSPLSSQSISFVSHLVGGIAKLLRRGRHGVHMLWVFLFMFSSDLSVWSCSESLFCSQNLVQLGKILVRSTQPQFSSLNCALCNISPQVESLSLRIAQCKLSAFQDSTHANTVLKCNLWPSKLCNFSLLPSQYYALHSLKAQASSLSS